MSTTQTPDRFTTLPDEQALEATVVALEEHGFSVEVVDDLDAARKAVLARIPRGSSVMTNTWTATSGRPGGVPGCPAKSRCRVWSRPDSRMSEAIISVDERIKRAQREPGGRRAAASSRPRGRTG
jgi:hypothetical protein